MLYTTYPREELRWDDLLWLKLKLETRQKEDDRGCTAFSDTTRAEAAMEERAKRNVEVAMERRIARIMESRKGIVAWKRLGETCWNVGEDLERLEFSKDGVTNTLYRINDGLFILNLPYGAEPIDNFPHASFHLRKQLCIARVVGLHMSMWRLRKKRKEETEMARRDAKIARLVAELVLLRRERDIERKLAMESEEEGAAGLSRAGGTVSPLEDVAPTPAAEVPSDEADTASTAVFGGGPGAAGDVAAVTDVERRDQPGGASAPSSGESDATTDGNWGATLSSAEGAEVCAEPFQQFPGASAELGETDVASTHGDEESFSVLYTPPLSASFMAVAEDDRGAVDSSGVESSSDGGSDNGGGAEEDSSSSNGGGRGGGNSSSSDDAEWVEKVRARRGVDFPFDRGKVVAPRSSPQLQRSRQRGGEEEERRR